MIVLRSWFRRTRSRPVVKNNGKTAGKPCANFVEKAYKRTSYGGTRWKWLSESEKTSHLQKKMVNEKLQGWTKKTHEFAIIAVSHLSRIFYEVKDDDYVSRKTKCPNNSVTNYFLYLVKKKMFFFITWWQGPDTCCWITWRDTPNIVCNCSNQGRSADSHTAVHEQVSKPYKKVSGNIVRVCLKWLVIYGKRYT